MIVCVYFPIKGNSKKIFETHETNKQYLMYSIKSFANLERKRYVSFLPIYCQQYKNQGKYEMTNTNTKEVSIIYVKGDKIMS